MTGHEYANLIASYIVRHFGPRGLKVYREVNVGKTVIGKNRRLDLFVVDERSGIALAVECKFQDSPGTVDEKIPYTLQDMEAMGMPVCLAYAGGGFSEGILHMLEASRIAAYCLPDPETLEQTDRTRELDAALAINFRWWDVIVGNKKPFGAGDD